MDHLKHYIEPSGKFFLKIPIEWQYVPDNIDKLNKSPYSFQLYDNPEGAFQISCYSAQEKKLAAHLPIHEIDTDQLKFEKVQKIDDGFSITFWFAMVADHAFIAKYICGISDLGKDATIEEFKKVEQALSTLKLLGPESAVLALERLRLDNFLGSLAASYDLKMKALNNKSVIEFLIIVANQIDAHLRMSLVLKKQLKENTQRIDTTLLFQSDTDTPIMERKIYKQALVEGIITQLLFDQLESLYKERNKVVHRYIITEFKTADLYEIGLGYAEVDDLIRNILKQIEEEQIEKQMGFYGNMENPGSTVSTEEIRFWYSKVNDKHLTGEFHRPISG